MSLLLPLSKLSDLNAVEQIMETNKRSTQYGLVLTHEDAVLLVETRNCALRENGRIEIGGATIQKIIEAFCNSSYIMQDEYAAALHELLEIFYYIKNETLDLIADDELIALMKNYFEYRCQGSLELLKGRELEKMARNLRYDVTDYSNLKDDDEACEEEF